MAGKLKKGRCGFPTADEAMSSEGTVTVETSSWQVAAAETEHAQTGGAKRKRSESESGSCEPKRRLANGMREEEMGERVAILDAGAQYGKVCATRVSCISVWGGLADQHGKH